MPQLLVEKYRPHTLQDMVGFVPNFTIDQNLPHLLLHGIQGSGKTTLARIIIDMLDADSITLNASSERGIDTVRDKVTKFASTQSSNSGIKIVFLDEADHLTNDAQTALRNIMETFSSNCRFILTANFVNRIIDPIRSRCVAVTFGDIPQEKVVDRLRQICEAESIKYEEIALVEIVSRTRSDMRSAINKVEELRAVGILMSNLGNDDGAQLASDVYDLLVVDRNFMSARQLYLDAAPDPEQFLKDLHDVIIERGAGDMEAMQQRLMWLANEYKYIRQVAWTEILVENVMLRMMSPC